MTPSPALDEEGDVARLSLVAGAGGFGSAVLDLLEGQVGTLPDPLRWATGLVHLDGEDEPTTALTEAREEVTRLPNTNRIEESEWGLAGGDQERRVRHFVAGSADRAAGLTAVADARLDEETVDPWVAVLRCDDPSALAEVDLRPWSSVFLLAGENRLGETLAERDVAGAAAGAILLSLIHPLLDRIGERTPLATFGFAGRYGLSGPAFGRLSAGMARWLVEEHAVPAGEVDEELGAEAGSVVEKHDPRRLGERLFDRELQRRGAPTRGGPSEMPIPAVVGWERDTLGVDLERGSLAQEATPPGEEDDWPAKVRRVARSWEMTRSYAWRRRLEAAARALSDEIRNGLPEAFDRLLRKVPRSPSEAERAADRMEELAGQNHEAEPVRERDLEVALGELEAALEDRSSPAALGARLALWTLPAVVAGVPVVRSLYDGFRGAAFPLLFGGLSAAAVIGWYLWRLVRDRDRLLEARDEVLDVLVRRWEGLLSEAAVRALEDEVLPALRSTVGEEVRDRISACRSWLDEVGGRLDDVVGADLFRAATFAPVLEQEEEYDRVIGELGLGPARHLADAVGSDLLDPDGEPDRVEVSLRTWCGERAREAIAAAGLGFGDLWTIRMRVRDDEDELGPTADRLWRFAEPLAGDARVRSGGAIELVTAPSAMAGELRGGAGADRAFDADRVEELSSVPLLACFRAVPLEVRGVEVG